MKTFLSRTSLPGVLLLMALTTASSPASASVVAQTVVVGGENLYTTTTPGAVVSFSKTSSASFLGFDASLGTLTGVTFNYDFGFDYTQDISGGGGSAGLNIGYKINGQAVSNPPPQPQSQTLSSSTSLDLGYTIVPPSALSTFLAGYTFDAVLFGGFGSGGPGGYTVSSILDLTGGSVTATYDYVAAAPSAARVPEPSSLALFGISGLALGLQRRRRVARDKRMP